MAKMLRYISLYMLKFNYERLITTESTGKQRCDSYHMSTLCVGVKDFH